MKRRAHSTPASRNEGPSFAALIGDVAPLPPHGRADLGNTPPRPFPAQRVRDEAAALRENLSDGIPGELALETGEALRFLRPGVPGDALRKLRRGHWRTDGELDLHGCNVEEARLALGDFLRECGHRSARCVRIVHGKGLGSKNREPVLKMKVATWLAQRDDVLAYCQARAADGGAGAVMVLLRSGSRRRDPVS